MLVGHSVGVVSGGTAALMMRKSESRLQVFAGNTQTWKAKSNIR